MLKSLAFVAQFCFSAVVTAFQNYPEFRFIVLFFWFFFLFLWAGVNFEALNEKILKLSE